MTYIIKKDHDRKDYDKNVYVDIFDCLIQRKEFKDYAFGRVLKDLA